MSYQGTGKMPRTIKINILNHSKQSKSIHLHHVHVYCNS
jgi:hypothetical protein